jgi:hypothetical protein
LKNYPKNLNVSLYIYPHELAHDDFFIQQSLELNPTGHDLVFLDPDIIFYSEVESYLNNIKELLAGRYVPFYYNEVVKAHEAERFHTSLLYIKDVEILNRKLTEFPNTRNFPFNPIQPFQFSMGNKRFFYDTCANLYHSLFPSDRHNFAPEMLDKYTHLCCGSMLNYISAQMKNGERLKFLHDLAKKYPEKVQGLWKEHDRYYQSMQLPL